MRSVATTHVGRVRKHNEDSFLDRTDLGLWVVADGMGGMTAGEVASQALVAALDSIPPGLDGPTLTVEVRTRIENVNAQLIQMAEARGPDTTIGCTVAGLLTRNGHFACFWAGDSRVYRLRRGELDRLTRDHSLVQDMIDSGLLQPHEAETHPMASVIQRAVGVDTDFTLDWVHAPMEDGDIFLLCSDGLTRMVPDEEIEATLGRTPIDQSCTTLIERTLERGAKDNVTVILVAA